ncbi:MAG: phenylalanine--tRNA ligase subunit alpha [Deltaproteobacteria bacterium]|nr:phenylalanine--tRNA ligase subunit alpha [Deltaproteobacteria bacterium]
MEDLKRIERSVLARARRAKAPADVAEIRAEVLGKKGPLGLALRSLGELPAEERPAAGQKINQLKGKIEAALDEAHARVQANARADELESGAQDVTLPGRRVVPGNPHPLRIVERDIIRALESLGFAVAHGPQVEHDWYNFEALNFPPDHPARDTQDTFFVSDAVVLRTHTSNVQIRTMVKGKPPIRILAPGMVFRHDEIDATHTPCFHQIEGLWVDDKATFADLKGVLHVFAARLFGPERKVRFRPSFFPFTEPSAEMDVSCALCGGSGKGGCRPCKGTGWIEIMGAGMVDPAVFEAVGYDPEKVQGFAFGMGLERIALLRWGVDDIRLFYENDLRFLEQFRPGDTR